MDVVLNVPALVLVEQSEHGLLLDVCCPLAGESGTFGDRCPADRPQPEARPKPTGTALTTPEAMGQAFMRAQVSTPLVRAAGVSKSEPSRSQS